MFPNWASRYLAGRLTPEPWRTPVCTRVSGGHLCVHAHVGEDMGTHTHTHTQAVSGTCSPPLTPAAEAEVAAAPTGL